MKEESKYEFFNRKKKYNFNKMLCFIFNNLLQSTDINTSLL